MCVCCPCPRSMWHGAGLEAVHETAYFDLFYPPKKLLLVWESGAAVCVAGISSLQCFYGVFELRPYLLLELGRGRHRGDVSPCVCSGIYADSAPVKAGPGESQACGYMAFSGELLANEAAVAGEAITPRPPEQLYD